MIVKEEFVYSEKKELKLGNGPELTSVLIYKGENGIRLFISSQSKGDVDIFLNNREENDFLENLKTLLLRAIEEPRGFCKSLTFPQLGDFDEEVNAQVQFTFFNKNVGISIDVKDIQGVELWSDLEDIRKLITLLQ